MIDKARRYCIMWHGTQMRKYVNKPYHTHPEAVAKIVSMVSTDPSTIAAAYLHDVIEDTVITYEEVHRQFGEYVAGLVRQVSDVSKPEDGNRAVRKAIDRKHLASASPRGQTIKLADLIHNTLDIQKYDKSFAKLYMSEKKLLLPVLGGGDRSLFLWANAIVEDYYAQ